MEEEYVDIDLDNKGELLPPKNDKVLLVDADTIIFAACVTTQVEEELLPRWAYTDLEWMEIESSPHFNEEKHTLRHIDLDVAYTAAKEKLDYILSKTGCNDYELHFTGGYRNSFRYTLVSSDYKQNRREYISPVGLMELKMRFVNNDPERCFIHHFFEADDAVIAKMRALPDKYILAAQDKDVLYSMPGRHYNYYSSEKYDIEMKWVEVDETTAMKHHYLQCLTGDTTDNIKGIKGIGPKKAAAILADCTTPQECWVAVVVAYEEKEMSEADAIITMRLVSMHQVTYDPDADRYTLKLFKRDTYENR